MAGGPDTASPGSAALAACAAATHEQAQQRVTDEMGDSGSRRFTLSYGHTRLHSIGNGARIDHEQAEREQLRQGL